MKRKYADRPNWTRIIEKSYKGIFIDEDSFYGYAALLTLDKVKEPLIVNYAENAICIVNDGFAWLQHFPLHGSYVLTSTFDSEGVLVQWYFDIVKKVGLSDEGIPYCDDLYLDVVALPTGEIYTLDEEELLEALEQERITQEDYDYALSEASALIRSIEQGKNALMNSSQTYYNFLKTLGK